MASKFASYGQNYTSLLHVLLLLSGLLTSSSDLSFNFYAGSCPVAEFLDRNTVRSASSSDPTIPGKLLRLFFHDCFVQGITQRERSDPGNASLGGFSVIEKAKNAGEIFCPATVSCADIVALAARDAIEAVTFSPLFTFKFKSLYIALIRCNQSKLNRKEHKPFRFSYPKSNRINRFE
ncbi:unnamed protein product [Arabis nemorensis]|uniref:peroxidase n=1 Tax=Arabis nemorensis TaxID=586526 RepID=A0A565CB17_9BRAS|nr:unnamed protein product [Arabis nemorensis]